MGSLGPSPSIVHVVHFRFAATASSSTRADISRQFLALQSTCLSPATHKPYIKSFTGGRDVSVENLHHGFSHVFVLEFENESDRDWYVSGDPVHRRFGVEVLTGVVEEVLVMDFRRGEF